MTHTRMTDTQWLRIRSFLDTGSGLRVGKDAHCRLFVESLRWMARMGAPGRALPPEYGKWNSVYGRYRYAAWCNQGIWPRLLAHLEAKPDVSAVRLDSTIGRAHVSAAGAPQKKEAEPALGCSRRLQHPDPHPSGSTGLSPAPARDGRPAPRQHPGPGPGGSLDRRAPALPDRGSGL